MSGFPRQQNVPTMRFVIRVSSAINSEAVDYFSVDQACFMNNFSIARMEDSIQAFLHDMSNKTGLRYEIAYWGRINLVDSAKCS